MHNGIEYGDMQLIAEAASLSRELGGLSAAEVATLFGTLNDGALSSFGILHKIREGNARRAADAAAALPSLAKSV